MSFNWPEIPFTGAEVEAFVDAYIELAESIIDDYTDNTSTYPVDFMLVKSPYRQKENIKLFLEYGLIYAAFIVKQRAGNSGPGTNFILGSSPYNSSLTDEQKRKIIKRLGCTFKYSEMFGSYVENGKNDPDGSLPSLKDVAELLDDDYTKENCDDFWGWLTHKSTTEEEVPSCNAIILPIIAASIAKAVNFLLGLMFGLLARYLQGTGGVVSNDEWNTIGGSGSDILFRQLTYEWMTRPRKTSETKFIGIWTQPAHAFSGYTIQLTSSNASAYGVPGGKVWLLDTSTQIEIPSIKNVLGNYTVITNGSETIGIDTSVPSAQWDTPTGKAYISSMSPSNIKQIRDDYDFDDYGWKLYREPGELAGESFSDNQIKSGYLYDGTTTPCQAVSEGGSAPGKNPISGASRWIVANTHGSVKIDLGEYDPTVICQSKPFAIKLLF